MPQLMAKRLRTAGWLYTSAVWLTLDWTTITSCLVALGADEHVQDPGCFLTPSSVFGVRRWKRLDVHALPTVDGQSLPSSRHSGVHGFPEAIRQSQQFHSDGMDFFQKHVDLANICTARISVNSTKTMSTPHGSGSAEAEVATHSQVG